MKKTILLAFIPALLLLSGCAEKGVKCVSGNTRYITSEPVRVGEKEVVIVPENKLFEKKNCENVLLKEGI